MSNFRARLKTLKTGLSVRPASRTRFIRCGFLGGCRRFSHGLLFSHARSWVHRKNDGSKTSCSRFFDVSCSYGPLHAHGKCGFLLFVCRDHSAPPLLGGKHGMGSLGFRSSYADNFGVLVRGANSANVHLARFIAIVKRDGLDVHEVSHTSEGADALCYEVSPANSFCSGTGKRIARVRSVARTISSRRRICGRAMELVDGHESSLALSSRGKLQVRAGVLFEFRRALVDCAFVTKSILGRILCFLRSHWNLRWHDVCICTDASGKGFALGF